MESPAKRRKKNDSKPAPIPARGLDFFFGNNKKRGTDHTQQTVTGDSISAIRTKEGLNLLKEDPPLTDEELARKLQAEWADEDLRESRSSPAQDNQGDHKIPEDDPAKANKEDFLAKVPESKVPVVLSTADAGRKNFLGLQSTANEEDMITQNIPFDQSPFTFDPQVFLPELKKHWAKDGGEASYALLTRCFVLINSTTSRIKTVDTLVNCLRLLIEGDPDSLLPAVWLATNSISPPYISLELGLGGSTISKALKKVCGLDNPSLKTLYDKYGDAGDVAFEAKKKQSFTLKKPKPLSIKSVYQTLVKIANSKGHGSVEQKQRLVERLVQDCRGAEESRYVVRTLVQHLRIGAVKTTMLIALARAFSLTRPPSASFEIKDINQLARLKKEDLAPVWAKAEEIVKTCFARRPNYNDIVLALLEIGVCDELILRCDLTMHVPLRPMLGNITRDLTEMLTKLQGRDFGCEFKYDGQRAQVHCDKNGQVSIFSRHLELMTEKYPDLVALVPEIRGDGVSSFILEGEVVAVDQETGDLKTFQSLTNRARKDVELKTIQVNVCLFAFDLMYLNGRSLLNRPFRERRGLLRSMFVEKKNRFTWVKSIDATSQDSETVLEFFKAATDMKCEGIMVKVLDNLANPDLLEDGEDRSKTPSLPPTPSKKLTRKRTQEEKEQEKLSGARRKALLATYEPDKRLDSWLKVKKDYNSTTFDTIDLIPVAGWHGQGRKAAWWSPVLLACRNPETGSLEVVTKCMSGFSDTFYKGMKEKYAEDGPNTTNTKPSYVEYSGGHPAIWFEPQEVWEIAFADITLSPVYTAAIGLVSDERGLSMRFPRFLRTREDKSLEEASTNEFLANLYRKQEERSRLEGKAGDAAAGMGEDGLDGDD